MLSRVTALLLVAATAWAADPLFPQVSAYECVARARQDAAAFKTWAVQQRLAGCIERTDVLRIVATMNTLRYAGFSGIDESTRLAVEAEANAGRYEVARKALIAAITRPR